MDRLEEIRESLKTAQNHTTSLYWGPGGKRYPEDVSYLLERIEHLQRENERLKVVLKGEREGMPALIERTERLMRENERLREIADAAHAEFVSYLPYTPTPDENRLVEAFRAANYPTVFG